MDVPADPTRGLPPPSSISHSFQCLSLVPGQLTISFSRLLISLHTLSSSTAVRKTPTMVLEVDGMSLPNTDQRLHALGYKSEFRRDMSLFGVLGISFCAIGILTGMSSALQTGLFSGGPFGLFWGWNICSLSMFLIALLLAEIYSA
ncbi:unnamed protein product [Somion occarium]|uniref:Uncharacterized protein n=1 Tax=Somion occarium TaxID=3059160 RepID=A0ABP1DTE3_9APHY